MRTHNQTFKQNIIKYGREFIAKIHYYKTSPATQISNEEINSIQLTLDCGLLKSAMYGVVIDCDRELEVGENLYINLSVKNGNSYTDNVNLGWYIVKECEKQENTNSYKITCYDNMLKAMKDYQGVDITYPATIREYLTGLCEELELEFVNAEDEFVNYDKVIESDIYNGTGYTYRDVLDDLAEVTASNITADSLGRIKLKYITDTEDTIGEECLKNVNVNFGETFGKINTIVLSRSAEADNIYLDDPESVELNGRCEVKITDNQIMNFDDRSEYLPAILEQLDGLEFSIFDISTTGICYYEVGDMFTVEANGNQYKCVMFADEINITQGLEETMYTDRPENSEPDYKHASKTDKGFIQANIVAKKNEAEIEMLTSRTETIENQENNNYQELLAKFDNVASTDDITSLQNLVRQIQTDTYTKTEIQQIARGVAQDGTEVSYVKTTSATFDEDGMHYEKSGANTSSTVNEVGIRVNDTSGSTSSELLFAGYDSTQQEALVRVANLYLTRYLGLSNWRIEQIQDSTYGTGIGFFYLG